MSWEKQPYHMDSEGPDQLASPLSDRDLYCPLTKTMDNEGCFSGEENL